MIQSISVSINHLSITQLTHFWSMFPFYTPWKHRKTYGFSGVFRGYKTGTFARDELRFVVIFTSLQWCFIQFLQVEAIQKTFEHKVSFSVPKRYGQYIFAILIFKSNFPCLKVMASIFLLFCFLSLKKCTFETRKNLYFTSKILFGF